jgi:hypothetical protein
MQTPICQVQFFSKVNSLPGSGGMAKPWICSSERRGCFRSQVFNYELLVKERHHLQLTREETVMYRWVLPVPYLLESSSIPHLEFRNLLLPWMSRAYTAPSPKGMCLLSLLPSLGSFSWRLTEEQILRDAPGCPWPTSICGYSTSFINWETLMTIPSVHLEQP